MILTRRKKIIALLKEREWTAKELAEYFGEEYKFIVEDIWHIKKSVMPKHRLIVKYAQCMNCGFQFKERTKLRTPSKCPKCRHESISEPKFYIK